MAAVSGKFAEDPARAREILGYGSPTKRTKKGAEPGPGGQGGPAPRPQEE